MLFSNQEKFALLNVSDMYGVLFCFGFFPVEQTVEIVMIEKKNNVLFDKNCACVPYGFRLFNLCIIFQIRTLMFLSSTKAKQLRSFIQL